MSAAAKPVPTKQLLRELIIALKKREENDAVYLKDQKEILDTLKKILDKTDLQNRILNDIGNYQNSQFKTVNTYNENLKFVFARIDEQLAYQSRNMICRSY